MGNQPRRCWATFGLASAAKLSSIVSLISCSAMSNESISDTTLRRASRMDGVNLTVKQEDKATGTGSDRWANCVKIERNWSSWFKITCGLEIAIACTLIDSSLENMSFLSKHIAHSLS
uniref:Secreted protein n=1 Tax=Cacopsylla melanoneura TaxID=428564 RepID=A0A8D8VLS0_9HEMI